MMGLKLHHRIQRSILRTYLKGAASVLDIAGTRTGFHLSKNPTATDLKVTGRDWKVVGRDISAALDKERRHGAK